MTVFRTFCLIACGYVLSGCQRQALPDIKDPAHLKADCQKLSQTYPANQLPTNTFDFAYQTELGIRKIPPEHWSASIKALNPYMVCTYRDGVQIWFLPPKGSDGTAYHVLSNPNAHIPEFSASNHFVFVKTIYSDIYQVTQDFQKN